MTKPSLLCSITPSRSEDSSEERARLATRKQWLTAAPRPTRPRSWCNCERPKRSADSMTITEALGTSTPTSTTVVHTSTWRRPARKASITASFSSAFIRPCSSPTSTPGNTCRSLSAPRVASSRSSFSDSSTSGYTT